jgi:hypothetical protein
MQSKAFSSDAPNEPKREPAMWHDDPELPDDGTRLRTLEQQAGVADAPETAIRVRDGAMPAFLFATMAELFGAESGMGFKFYRDRLLADCGLGEGSDPIAVMLVEQLAIAHINVGRLHAKAATAANCDEARAYLSAAVQLAGEFRRGALALKSYREPSLPRVVAEDERRTGRKTGRRRTGT